MTEVEAKWSERVQAWKSSGQSADEYSAGLGVRPSTLRWWASRLKQLGAPSGGNLDGGDGPRMVRVVTRAKPVENSLTLRIGPAQLEVRTGFDRALLRELVEALGDRA